LSQVSELLRQGVAELGLALSQSTTENFLKYLALLAKWNRVYNLTAIREESKWVSHQLLDSLAVVPHLPPGRVVDVGSGAGLPGIPIALACPQRPVTLLDCNQKKGAFLTQASNELSLANVEVVIDRAESYHPGEEFDVVISRAFSSIAEFVRLAGHLCKSGGVLAAMKGIRPDSEIAQLPDSWNAESIIPLRVPQLDAERHLIFVRQSSAAVAK